MSKHPQIKSLEHDIEKLETKVMDLKRTTANVHWAVLNNDKPGPFFKKRHDFIIPDIHRSIRKFYISDSNEYKSDEYEIVYCAIAMELTNALKQVRKQEKKYMVLDGNNINNAVQSIYDNPNHFLQEYQDLRTWQLDGSEPEAGTFWICEFSLLGNIMSHLEDLQKIHNAYYKSVKIGNMPYALNAIKLYERIRNL